MPLYIARDGQQIGPLTPEEVQAQLAAGTIQLTDLAWQEGNANWLPLHTMPGFAAGMPPVLSSVPPPLLQPQTSALAITSLVLGIMSFFTIGLTGLPAVICGHLAASRIKRSGGRLTGQGMAVAGLVTGYIGFLLIFLGVLAGIALPVFNTIQDRGLTTKGMAEAKQIVLACKLYAIDHHGHFPETLDQLIPTYLQDKHLFVCPLNKHDPSGYEYLGGNESDPPDKVVLRSKAQTQRHQRIIVHLDDTCELRRE